jgi:ketosteroid isomerase-like protein
MKVTVPVFDAMRQTNKLFGSEVIKKGNIEQLDFVYTANARILPPGAQMIQGRSQIKAFWRQAIKDLDLKSATLSTVDAEAAGDGVIEIGRADLTVGDGQIVAVKYVVHWKKEGDRWKWHVDIWNLNQ